MHFNFCHQQRRVFVLNIFCATFFIIYFLPIGPYCIPIHHEWRVREVARMDWFRATGRRRMFGIGRGAGSYWGCGVARSNWAVQPEAAGLWGQAAGLPRARRRTARALARAPALPPAAPGAARLAPRASLAPAPSAPRAHQATLTRSAHFLSCLS